MQEKVQAKKQRKVIQEPEVLEKVEAKAKPIFHGIATTDLIVNDVGVGQGEQVDILEDKGDEWLTDKGLVSKLFLLLKKTHSGGDRQGK